MVAVTTASARQPWSPAALFLNAYHQMAVRATEWEGERAIRDSGLEYVILRPYGLGPWPSLGCERAWDRRVSKAAWAQARLRMRRSELSLLPAWARRRITRRRLTPLS